MGQNVERLGRLKANRTSFAGIGVRSMQNAQRIASVAAVTRVSEDLQKVARTDGFEGDLGTLISERLTKIRAELARFDEYQQALGKVTNLANEALSETAGGMAGLPETGLTAAQQNTIDVAKKTGSPVQVAPGVSLTASQASQWYQQQAEAEQEEAARKLNAALDLRLQQIIDNMPVSEWDEKPPTKNFAEGDDPRGNGGVTGPGLGGGDSSVSGPGTGDDSGNYDGPGVHGPGDNGGNTDDGNTDDGTNNPPKVTPPVIDRPPQVDPTWPPRYIGDPDGPRIDGGIDGGVPPVTGGPGPGGSIPGGPGPGGGITGPGGVPGPGGGGAAGGIAGGVAGGVAGGIGGAGRLGGVGAPGGIAGAGSGAAGIAGGAGGAGAAGQAGSGSRGMMGGAMHGGGAGGGAGGKKNRRRGQDLFAYEVDEDGEEVAPDLGAAGAAGSSASDGREEIGW